jgi:hypothetical protein
LDNLITIKTFTYSSEVLVLRGRLESEGIECFVQDELTIQVDPFYSNTIGGVKLKVRESDLEKAMEILKEGGYITDEPPPLSPLYQKLENATSDLPLIKNLPPDLRLYIVVVLFIVVAILLIYKMVS